MLANVSISGLYKDHLYKIYPEFMQKLSLKKFGVCECVHVFSMCQSKDNVSLLLIEIIIIIIKTNVSEFRLPAYRHNGQVTIY